MKKITKFINQIIKDTKDRMACDSIFLMAVFGLFLFGIIFILSCIGSLCNFEPKQDLINEGFSVMTAEIVDALSKKEGETYFDFIMRIHNGDSPYECGAFRVGMVAVKLADLRHNMSDLKEGSLKDKYRFAEYILNYFNPKK